MAETAQSAAGNPFTGRLAFVGSGTMAEAMIKAVLRQGLVGPSQITASGPRPERGQELRDRYGIATTTDNAVVSIVAGATILMLQMGLGHGNVIRTMPNTPAQIGQGMTVWISTPECSMQQSQWVEALLLSMGEAVRVEEEVMLDMATAVSGTGPTYIFLMMEAMTDAAVHLGFSRRVALQLVQQTVLGSVLYARQSRLHLAELRTVLSKAIWAAYQKSRLLGQLKWPPDAPERQAGEGGSR